MQKRFHANDDLVYVKIQQRHWLCTGPRPVPARQMKDDFFNGPGRQMRGVYSNGAGRAGKREMSFPMAGPATKKRSRIILRLSPDRNNKKEVFKPAPKYKRITMYLI